MLTLATNNSNFTLIKKNYIKVFLGGLPLCYTQFLGVRLPISFTLSLTDSELAFYFEKGVGSADLFIIIIIYILKEHLLSLKKCLLVITSRFF